jgi:hypothetical protein
MTFSEALDVLTHGGRISREAWHGARFVFLEPERTFEPAEGHPLHGFSSRATYRGYLMIFDINVLRPWHPQLDDYADDWCEVRN